MDRKKERMPCIEKKMHMGFWCCMIQIPPHTQTEKHILVREQPKHFFMVTRTPSFSVVPQS